MRYILLLSLFWVALMEQTTGQQVADLLEPALQTPDVAEYQYCGRVLLWFGEEGVAIITEIPL
jgi:hypothetical protein